jgi:hypothetical protein
MPNNKLILKDNFLSAGNLWACVVFRRQMSAFAVASREARIQAFREEMAAAGGAVKYCFSVSPQAAGAATAGVPAAAILSWNRQAHGRCGGHEGGCAPRSPAGGNRRLTGCKMTPIT